MPANTSYSLVANALQGIETSNRTVPTIAFSTGRSGPSIGVALWAFLSEEAEAKLMLPLPRLRPDERKSGDRCWLVDLVAPFANGGSRIAAAMLADLQKTALVGRIYQCMIKIRLLVYEISSL